MRRPNPNQLALFTERMVAGKLRFAFAVKRHFSGRMRRARGAGTPLTRKEMNAMHALFAVAWNSSTSHARASCAEDSAMAIFQALEAE